MTDSTALRRARFRLQRQGMLELDRWLAPLDEVLINHPKLVADVEMLLNCEPQLLQQMMEGETTIPKELQPWLA